MRIADLTTSEASLILYYLKFHDSIRDLPGSTPARKLLVDRALKYLDSLAAEGGNDLSLLRELATAYERVGEVQGHYLQNSLGDTAGSLLSYQRALQTRQKLCSTVEGLELIGWRWRNLSSYGRESTMGDRRARAWSDRQYRAKPFRISESLGAKRQTPEYRCSV